MEQEALTGLSKQEREIISYFLAIEQETINLDDIESFHSCSRNVAKKILSRLYKKGWLQKLKSGIYYIVPLSSLTSNPVIENIWPLATKIFQPAFISGWSAAEHWDFTEQIFNSVSVITAAPQRKTIQDIGNIKFRVRVLPQKKFFGLKSVWFGSKSAKVADPSRMLIDILDLPRFGGGMRHTIDVVREYWLSDKHDADLLLDYALRYKRGAVIKRLGFLAEKFNAPVSKEWIQLCQNNITKGVILLDPDGAKKGKIVSKWNLQINLPL